MTTIYLLRHGEANYAPVRDRNWPGSMADLAPLTDRGVREAIAAAGELATAGVARIVSSPYTRTMHTASFVASRLGLPVEVEFGLHEWLPDDTFSWHTRDEVQIQARDFDAHGGEWPDGERRPWEPLSAVRRRAGAAVLAAAGRTPDGAVVAVCHETVIRSLSGERFTPTGQFRPVGVADLADVAAR
jgi:broad specificity phosphatase PhoE